jgi:hypothetical protein
MKKIILQHWIGELGELEKLSSKNIESYAKYCNADYRLLRGTFIPGLSPQSQKMHMLNKEFDEYDVVVMMDTDMFTRKGKRKNIFTEETGIGRHYGIQTSLIQGVKRSHPFLADPSYAYWGGSIYRIDKDMRQKLRANMRMNEMVQFNNGFNDEGIMHRLAVLCGIKNNKKWYMDRRQWNHESFEEERDQAEIIHIRPKVKPGGPKKPKIENYKSLVNMGIL